MVVEAGFRVGFGDRSTMSGTGCEIGGSARSPLADAGGIEALSCPELRRNGQAIISGFRTWRRRQRILSVYVACGVGRLSAAPSALPLADCVMAECATLIRPTAELVRVGSDAHRSLDKRGFDVWASSSVG